MKDVTKIYVNMLVLFIGTRRNLTFSEVGPSNLFRIFSVQFLASTFRFTVMQTQYSLPTELYVNNANIHNFNLTKQ